MHVLGSSVQFLPLTDFLLGPKAFHRFFAAVEGWAHFPRAKRRLLELARATNVSGLIVISGDVHFWDFYASRPGCALSYPLVEFTSSGLTHDATEDIPRPATNWLKLVIPKPHFVSGSYLTNNFQPNYGLLRFDWEADGGPLIAMQARGTGGGLIHEHNVSLADLQAGAYVPAEGCRDYPDDLPPIVRYRVAICTVGAALAPPLVVLAAAVRAVLGALSPSESAPHANGAGAARRAKKTR